MVAPKKQSRRKVRKGILGLGLDNKDEHVRITQVEDFHLLGGSEDTHSKMQEQAVKFNEELKKRGKTLQDAPLPEVKEIADKLDMPMA
jgi:hypothetical protein